MLIICVVCGTRSAKIGLYLMVKPDGYIEVGIVYVRKLKSHIGIG